MAGKSWFSSSGFWALLLLLLVLGLQYLGGLYALEVSRISKESELGTHLDDLGRLAQGTLRDNALDLSDLALDAVLNRDTAIAGVPDPDYYRRGLREDRTEAFDRFARDARLARLVLIDERGRVLYNTADPDAMLDSFEFLRIDEDEIRQAFNNTPAASPAYAAGDDLFKRCYVPIAATPLTADDSDETTLTSAGAARPPVPVVLALVAGRDYLGQIDRLALVLRRAGAVLTLLMLVIAALIWSLLRRQRRTERQAAEADRLAGLGTLAAGFAHELRNPLGIIRAFTEDLERNLHDGAAGGTDPRSAAAEAAEVCREIVEEVDRMNRLVGGFLSYTRGDEDPGEAPPAPVTEVLQSALTMLRATADKKRVALRLTGGDGVPLIAAIAPGRLRQIVMNLMLNAIEAAPPGSAISLRLEAASRQIRLSVSDEGEGVGEKDARRIFEPFYTTRRQGSGLGLAISRQLAQRAGGDLLLAAAKKGGGATFILRLNRVTAPE